MQRSFIVDCIKLKISSSNYTTFSLDAYMTQFSSTCSFPGCYTCISTKKTLFSLLHWQ